MKRLQKMWCLTALITTATFFLAGFNDVTVSANNTPATLPVAINWTGAPITMNDDWSGVVGVEGFLGQDITTATGTDPRTLLTTSTVANDLDVIANQTNPDTLTNGGVAEFEIANPTIALNGSGTADAPHIILYLNTTGQSNVRVSYNIRDLDASTDNSVQPVNMQYRVGSTGNFINVAGGFVADATTGPSQATLVTPVAATLPAAANNQPLVQVRIITTNAVGNDEWVGIDDISVTPNGPVVANKTPVDFNGDGKTDFAVIRNVDQLGFLRWYWALNGGGGGGEMDFGLLNDKQLAEDFDGDGKDDIAVWRSAGANSAFYIVQSQTNTIRITPFGLGADEPAVSADYDGDGKADEAVVRPNAAQLTWYYRGSSNNPSGAITYVNWGSGLGVDRIAPGDYDGDGKNDFVVRRDAGANTVYWTLFSNGTVATQTFGIPGDVIVPGDYDGDGKTDLAVVRAGTTWHYIASSTGAFQTIAWVAGDYLVPGDYDGDGKTDPGVWDETGGARFIARYSTTGGYLSVLFGATGDIPVGSRYTF